MKELFNKELRNKESAEKVGEKGAKILTIITAASIVSWIHGMAVIDMVMMFSGDRWWANFLGCTFSILAYKLGEEIYKGSKKS